MRRSFIGGSILLALLAWCWWPVVTYAAIGLSQSSTHDGAMALAEMDDIAACVDEPVPDALGNNPGVVGKPINLFAGAETYARTDLAIGSIFPISLNRQYNSRSGYDSVMGFGWASNYDRRLYTYPDGSITLRKNCGWKRRFVLSGGSYITPLGETGTLVKNHDGSYTYIYKNGDRDNYDERGRLVSRIDRNGASVVIYYELDSRSPLWGRLPANVSQVSTNIVAYDYRVSRIEEKDASGAFTNRYVLFHYDGATGRLTDIVDSAGRTVIYSHDSIGNLTGVTGPNGTMTYGYADTTYTHKMTSVDEGQGEYVNTYDPKGRVLKQTHGTGVIDVEYTEAYKKTRTTATIRDSSGTVLNTSIRTTEFDANGQPSKVTDTFGNVSLYTRDGNMYITREEYWENLGTVSVPTLTLMMANDYTYDGQGNMLTKTMAQGSAAEQTTTYTYHSTFNSVLTVTARSVVNPAQNHEVINTYDGTNGNLLTRTETGLLGNGTPFSYTTTYTYDANGKLQTVDGPRTDVSDVTTYDYDSSTGNLLSVTQPLVGTTTYSNHDVLGNPWTVTDPNGNGTTYTYDTNGRVATVKAPGDVDPTQYFYVTGGCSSCGGANKIDHIIMPEGNTITYTYDTMGNLASISDNENNRINYTYDSEGNRLTEEIRDSSGNLQKNVVTYGYDALNRLKRITNPDTSYTEYAYDFRGNRKSARNPNGNTTNHTYDALGRLQSVNQPGSVDTVYGYNSNNNLSSVQDDNDNSTQYKYDDKGRVYQVISPDTGTTTYTYDPAGNLKSKTDAKGVTISYTYDALNRLTLIDFPSDTDTVYAYDTCLNGKGRLCSMTDASGSTTYEYTPNGQVKKETKTIDSVQYVTQYTYDQNGNMKTMTYPSGKVITYNYANDGAVSVLNGASSLASNITYKPFGGMSGITYGNGLAGTVSYDNQYRITGISATGVMNLSYPTYDNNGNIQAINDAFDPTKSRSFTYDTLDRLGTANGSWGSLIWTYDGVGNRQTENSTSYTYQPGTNRLNMVSGVSFGFDNNGNTTAEGARQFVYNQNQRLIQVTDSGVTKGEYTYNGNGQRVKKVAGGVTTIFHYSRDGQIIAESDASGNITVEYVYLIDQLLAKLEGTNTYYYHNDHLGAPQKMTDASGSVVWAADYKPFGEVAVIVSTVTNNFRFPGQYYDSETGLHFNYFRDYNAVIGRYVQADPIGIQLGLNHLFVYADNNPIIFADPEGLCRSKIGSSTSYTMTNPGRANRYAYQKLEKTDIVGKLAPSGAGGECDCDNKIVSCTYNMLESYHSKIRNFNRNTREYGPWSDWDPNPRIPGYDDRLVGQIRVPYYCDTGTYGQITVLWGYNRF